MEGGSGASPWLCFVSREGEGRNGCLWEAQGPLAACLLFASPQPHREAPITAFLLAMRNLGLREVKERVPVTQSAWSKSICFPVPGTESQASVLLVQPLYQRPGRWPRRPSGPPIFR